MQSETSLVFTGCVDKMGSAVIVQLRCKGVAHAFRVFAVQCLRNTSPNPKSTWVRRRMCQNMAEHCNRTSKATVGGANSLYLRQPIAKSITVKFTVSLRARRNAPIG